MTDDVHAYDPYDDPPNAPFWAGARQRRLVLQRCEECGAHQIYARPFCLACEAGDLSWADATGDATVYSQVTVRIPVLDGLEPPYLCAIVHLDEGPHLLTHLVGKPTAIGDRVRLLWRERADEPPLPVFERFDSRAR